MHVIWKPYKTLAFSENNTKPSDLWEFNQGPEIQVIWKQN